MSPRDAILPAHRLTSVDAPNAWAGVYHRRLADERHPAVRRGSRVRPRTGPGSGGCTSGLPTFAVVGLAGVFYRRGVGGSLSEVGDDRQLDFIDAFAEIFAELAADPDGDRFRPKAVRGYCTLVDYHLSRRDRLTSGLAERLVERVGRRSRQLPADEVQDGGGRHARGATAADGEVLPA